MKGSSKGGVLSLDSVTMAKNKRKLEEILQVEKENTEKNKEKWCAQLNYPVSLRGTKTVKTLCQIMLAKRILRTLIYLKYETKERNHCQKSDLLIF